MSLFAWVAQSGAILRRLFVQQPIYACFLVWYDRLLPLSLFFAENRWLLRKGSPPSGFFEATFPFTGKLIERWRCWNCQENFLNNLGEQFERFVYKAATGQFKTLKVQRTCWCSPLKPETFKNVTGSRNHIFFDGLRKWTSMFWWMLVYQQIKHFILNWCNRRGQGTVRIAFSCSYYVPSKHFSWKTELIGGIVKFRSVFEHCRHHSSWISPQLLCGDHNKMQQYFFAFSCS